MRRRFGGRSSVVIALGLVAAAILIAPLGDGGLGLAVRIAAAVPLVFLLPGYAIVLALFPRWSGDGTNGLLAADDSVSRIERLTWTVGLSIGVSVLGAFLLNVAPGGLTRASWLIFLASATVLGGVVAKVVERVTRTARDAAPEPTRSSTTASDHLPRPNNRRAALAFLAAALVGLVAFGIAQVSEAAVPHTGFAQLWLVPQATAPEAATASTAEIGVHSYEEGDRQYRLVLEDKGKILQRWSFALSPGDVWRQQVDLRPGTLVEAQLYRGDTDVPYRRVSIQAQ